MGLKIPILITLLLFLLRSTSISPANKANTANSPPPPVAMTKKTSSQKATRTSATAAATDSTTAGGLKRLHDD